MRRPLIIALAFCLSACSSAATEGIIEPPAEALVKFSDVLAEYQALNARLEGVAAPLQLSNAALCPKTERSPGFTVHTITDYPAHLQPVAKTLLDVSDRLSLRTIRNGSPADVARLKPKDELVQIGETYIPGGKTVQTFYKAVAYSAYAAPSLKLTVRRDGVLFETDLKPETICGYPANVFFSEHVNGHTDGAEVWVTSQLLRTVDDDVNLALIVAHEMAHAIAGHLAQTPSKKLELEADRMALIMMARAGYNIDAAITYWQDAPHPHQRSTSKTHPSIAERFSNFKAARSEITAKQSRGETLTFN